MDGERAVSVEGLGSKFGETTFPVVDWVVGGNVPAIISHAVKGKFRSFAVLHWVAHQSAEVFVGERSVEAVCWTLHNDVPCIVGYREIPPIIAGTLDARVEPVHSVGGEVAAHHVARPEHLD